MNLAIIAVGNEILTGKTINTNTSYLANEIETLGAKVTYQQVVSDELDEIVYALKNAYEKADVVLTIGGLGPTVDDLTREGVAKYFKTDLIYDEKIYEGICDYFNRMNRTIPLNNKRQAYRFKESCVLTNHNGTAPGLFYEQDDRTVILLPGPPHELKALYVENVQPYILSKLKEVKIRRSYRLCGIGESYAEEKIISLYEKYPNLIIAPYCTLTHIDYIVTTSKTHEHELDQFEQDFNVILGEHIIGSQDTTLGEQLVSLLKSKSLTISTAESCSGGLLASSFVDVEGSSSVFLEGIVTYSYASKIRALTIDPARLEKYGAVSEEIAYDMAHQLKELIGSDIAVSVTGIAGPTGGTPKKPVGLVYIGLNIKGNISVYSYIFNGNREKIRQQTVARVQYLLFDSIKAL